MVQTNNTIYYYNKMSTIIVENEILINSYFSMMKQLYFYEYDDFLNLKNEMIKEKKRIEEGGSNCLICLEEIKEKSKMCRQCKVLYHNECLKEWFKQSKKCPHCRCENFKTI